MKFAVMKFALGENSLYYQKHEAPLPRLGHPKKKVDIFYIDITQEVRWCTNQSKFPRIFSCESFHVKQ